MTPKRRKMISKALLDLFESRAQEFQALINEKEETIEQYNTGDDSVQRELHKEIGETMSSAMKEIVILGNYFHHPATYYNKLLTFNDINIGNKIWDEKNVIIRDNAYVWSLLPKFKTDGKMRAIDIIDQTAAGEEMYTNSSFNSVDKGPGLDEPIVETISIEDTCSEDTIEEQNDKNFVRIYEAFTAMKNSFINGGAFRDHGIDFKSDSSWPPYDVYGSNGYVPKLIPSSYEKIPILYHRSGMPNAYSYKALIGDLIPKNTYVVASNSDNSVISIIKVFDITENSSEQGGEHGVSYSYEYKISATRIITPYHNTEVYLNKKINANEAYKVFNKIKELYLEHLTTFKTMFSNNTENYINEAVDDLMNYINSNGNMTTASNVLNFYSQATAFNILVNKRINELSNNTINSEDNLDDIKELMSIRVGKSNGTLFDIFRRIEGMDAQYIRYIKGNKRIDFLKKKMLVAKVIEQPNNSYQITIERNIDINYTKGENFRKGDTIYILDDKRPELLLKIVDIKYGTIKDVDSTNIKSDDRTTAVKEVAVRFITVNRIVSKDFDKTENLRIVKLL